MHYCVHGALVCVVVSCSVTHALSNYAEKETLVHFTTPHPILTNHMTLQVLFLLISTPPSASMHSKCRLTCSGHQAMMPCMHSVSLVFWVIGHWVSLNQEDQKQIGLGRGTVGVSSYIKVLVTNINSALN